MTELKSLSAPALGQAEVNRLLAMTRPSRMTSSSTLFDAGVEQAKRDFRAALLQAMRVPHHTVGTDLAEQVRHEAEAVKTAQRVSFFARFRP
jgi:uncharacterized protein (DUF305 family)